MMQVFGVRFGFEVGVGALQVAGGDVDPVVGEALRERLVFDEELHLEAGQQDLVEDPDDQLVLTDRKALHRMARGTTTRARGMGVTSDYTRPARRL